LHIAYDNMSKALTLYANICKAIFYHTHINTSVVIVARVSLILLLAINLWRVVVVVDPIHDAHCKLITLTTSFIPYCKTRNCIQFFQFLARFFLHFDHINDHVHTTLYTKSHPASF
jgi:hypothetical protein